ncbi:hypothetical protein ACFV28_04490 [Streptomyces sp. NPDC059720]|uniref:hypothetical protein n=1 Tax=Streptomyces sp. NPDC059720 TaxID=3346924 RepID=UPI0036B2E383
MFYRRLARGGGGGGAGSPPGGRGTPPAVAPPDLTALEQYLTANSSAGSPIAPPKADRITIVK